MDHSKVKQKFFKYSIIVLVICVSSLTFFRRNEDDLIVELVEPKGKIRGHILKSAKGHDYYAFQEIPYGKPPIGENRFRPAKIPDGWQGILDCTYNTKVCVQFNHGSVKFATEVKGSEDCLYLNVYTPVKPGTNTNLSVYLFIHGGAMNFGSGILQKYSPKYIIDGDIVVVTMNYRVGALGFLSTGDHVISGNLGLKDQHLALLWTRKNIHLFGGNPNDIVVGGGSSGAFCVGYQLLSSVNKGLINGFIQQSGSHLAVTALSLGSRERAFEMGRILDPSLPDNTSILAQTLRNAPLKQLVMAANQVANLPPVGYSNSIIWSPVVEDEHGEEPFITAPMHEEMIKGNFNRVPSLIGFNSEESLWFLTSNETKFQSIASSFDDDPSKLINAVMNVDNRSLVGEELRKWYTSTSFQQDPMAFIKFTSDISFVRSIIRQADVASKYSPVYLYQLSTGNYKHPKYKGIPHVVDMLFLWEMPPFSKITLPVDEEYRKIVLKLWWNFIKYKNPTPVIDPLLQNIKWPTVEPGNLRYLNMDKTLSIGTNPRNYNEMKNILLKYMKPPLYVF